MCRLVGLLLFLAGSGGLLAQKILAMRLHTQALQEMNQSLLRLHNAVAMRYLPIDLALRQETQECAPWLGAYYDAIRGRAGEHQASRVLQVLQEGERGALQKRVSAEESRLFIHALGALFGVRSPGEDRAFLAYYRQFDEIQKQDYMTKKERQKVTAAVMGTGFMMLLLLLL